MITIVKEVRDDVSQINITYRAMLSGKKYGIRMVYFPDETEKPLESLLEEYEPKVIETFKKQLVKLNIQDEVEIV